MTKNANAVIDRLIRKVVLQFKIDFLNEFDRINSLIQTMEGNTFVVIGNVDAGKSTLIGVLSSGQLDNGKGKTRESIMTLKHEKIFKRPVSFLYRCRG